MARTNPIQRSFELAAQRWAFHWALALRAHSVVGDPSRPALFPQPVKCAQSGIPISFLPC
jgi:hypothetical protein